MGKFIQPSQNTKTVIELDKGMKFYICISDSELYKKL
jgi:hypothetical protein